MSTKHTAGPWKVDTDIDDDGRKVFAIWANGSVIAQVDKLSNARLIAAAPALYTALQGMFARYVGLVASGDAGNWDAEQEAEVKAARAAIAKVEGQQP